jgi:hypothetical protein
MPILLLDYLPFVSITCHQQKQLLVPTCTIESKTKHVSQSITGMPRVFYLALGTENTLRKQASLPRAKQKALSTEKNTRQRFLYQEPTGWLSAKNFFAKCNFLTLGKENFKN